MVDPPWLRMRLLLIACAYPLEQIGWAEAAYLPFMLRRDVRMSSSNHNSQRLRQALQLSALEDEEDNTELSLDLPSQMPSSTFSSGDLSVLADRMSDLKAGEHLKQRLDALPHAWVIVFDVDTDEEAVYSMELPQEDKNVVAAFENREDAERYAGTLSEMEESEPSVQALDFEALVVSSREADFRVALVFSGDVQNHQDLPMPLIITGNTPQQPLNVAFTMVPEEMYAEKTSADFIDPAEDQVWVLVSDAGTGDASYFSVAVNGTDSIVCFKDESAALRCCKALNMTGAMMPSPESLLLEEVLEKAEEQDDDVEVCLVDEVVEMFGEESEGPNLFVECNDECDPSAAAAYLKRAESISGMETRKMLSRLLAQSSSDVDPVIEVPGESDTDSSGCDGLRSD